MIRFCVIDSPKVLICCLLVSGACIDIFNDYLSAKVGVMFTLFWELFCGTKGGVLNPSNAEADFAQITRPQRFLKKYLSPVMLVFI